MGQAKRKSKAKLAVLEQQIAAIPVTFDAEEWEAEDDFCIVDRIVDKSDMTAGGVVIPDVAKERSQLGTVILSGIPGLEPGRLVVFTRFGGTDVKLDGKSLVIVHRKQLYIRKKVKAAA
jgi:chaperonin GroES